MSLYDLMTDVQILAWDVGTEDYDQLIEDLAHYNTTEKKRIILQQALKECELPHSDADVDKWMKNLYPE